MKVKLIADQVYKQKGQSASIMTEKGGWTQRLHFRRGHIRTYKSGKKVFISAYMAGSAEKGTILKEYKIE